MYFKRIGNHTLPIPARASEDAAGLDLQSVIDCTIGENSAKLVPTGWAVEIPRDAVGLLSIRSGISKTGIMLTNGTGIIDPDYRGELMLSIINLSKKRLAIKFGDRIGQLVVVRQHPTAGICLETDELPPTTRGKGGFGSTS